MYGRCAKEITLAVGTRPNADGSADYDDSQTGCSGSLPKGTYSD